MFARISKSGKWWNSDKAPTNKIWCRAPFCSTRRSIDLHANLANYSELEIAKVLARHSVEIGPPKHYAPNHLVLEGKMRVVGVKAKKINKVVLIVKFISPPSWKKLQIQLFCTSLEPKIYPGQGADLSIMTPLKITILYVLPSSFQLWVGWMTASSTVRVSRHNLGMSTTQRPNGSDTKPSSKHRWLVKTWTVTRTWASMVKVHSSCGIMNATESGGVRRHQGGRHDLVVVGPIYDFLKIMKSCLGFVFSKWSNWWKFTISKGRVTWHISVYFSWVLALWSKQES